MNDHIRNTTSHNIFDYQVFLGIVGRSCCISNVVENGVEL